MSILLVAEFLDVGVLNKLKAKASSLGFEVVYNPELNRDVDPEIIFGHPPIEYVAKLTRLQWLHTHYAGVDDYVFSALPWPKDTILTNSKGINGDAGGDHVLAMMLYFMRGLYFFARQQQARRWVRDISCARLLAGQRLCIVGLGTIGRAVARRANAFGMHVVGVKRTPGVVPNVDKVVGPESLDEILPETDHLVLAVPLTAETYKMIDGKRLALLPKGSYLYNIGRGALVDEKALVDSLRCGHLAGAGLDVFVNEPLPEDHPLWEFPNVIITPHLGADTPWDKEHAVDLFLQNLLRYVRGEELLNRVSLERGY